MRGGTVLRASIKSSIGVSPIADPKERAAYLKLVSRIKHKILADYLTPWAEILGSSNRRLGYIDCFAGGGAYRDEEGQFLPGSPLIALDLAKKYVDRYPSRSLSLGFVEKNHRTSQRLRMEILARAENLPKSLTYFVEEEDAEGFVQRLISSVHESGTGNITPTFFFVDPYGHPISIPVLRDLLRLDKTEALVNLMWFRIAMNLENPRASTSLDKLFGHSGWRDQSFRRLQRTPKETAFLEYFASEVGAKYHFYLAVPFSPEDRVQGRQWRKKFYLMHLSNHPKAAILMKEIMSNARKELDAVLFPQQRKLFEDTPDLPELRDKLLQRFGGRDVSFDEVQIELLQSPYIATHYREVLKSMDGREVGIRRVDSKKAGLRGRDRIQFS